MPKIFIQSLVTILLCANLIFAQTSDTDAVKRINQQFKEITAGANSSERGIQIREELEKIRVKYSYLPFTSKGRDDSEIKGWNIIAEISNPKATKTLMIGAHYDRVEKGIGAVDNASGSVVILELLKAFKETPLENYNLKVAFWDKEELGLIGSREYVKSVGEEGLPTVYINFDVFGYGDTIFLKTQDKESKFSKAITKTSKEDKVKSKLITTYPPSDHLSFIKTKTETYSFSIMNEEEGLNLIKLIEDGTAKVEKFPEIAKIIHTENDNLERIDTNAIAKALAAIEKAIRILDK